MGSEGYGGFGVTAGSKLDSSSSFTRQNEASWNKMVGGKESYNMSRTNPPPWLESEARQQRKSVKLAKKSLLSQLEVCINETETDDIEGKALSPSKGIVLERTQTPKQKTNINGKRGDKRNGKAPKSRYDSFCVKSGLASFSAAAVGNNTLGGYGLRADLEDVTKHMNELSVDELLDGSYKCPSIARGKGKSSADPNENIVQSIKNVWSVLQTRKIEPQIVETDGNCHQEVLSPCYLTSNSFIESRNEGVNVDTNMVDVSPSHEVHDYGIKLTASTNILDFPLYEPLKILERLTLAPPKDLDFLLLDAAKPAAASRTNADLRSGKLTNHRGCLPPFSWSNAYSVHCKSNVDAAKLSTNRSTCQGRWVKIQNTITSPETKSYFLKELEALSYDKSIVPIEFRTSVPVINEKDRHESVRFTEQGLSTCPVDPQASLAVQSPGVLAAAQLLCDMATDFSKQYASGVTRSLKRPCQKSMRASHIKGDEKPENISGTPKSKSRFDTPHKTPEFFFPLKKPKMSVNEKSAEIFESKIMSKEKLVHRTGVPSRLSLNQKSAEIVKNDISSRGQFLPSWGLQPRPSPHERSTEIAYDSITPRGHLPDWVTPGSSRSSPGKSLRGSGLENKPYSIVKRSSMLPPAARTLEPASSSQPKPRKLMRIGWNREIGKLK